MNTKLKYILIALTVLALAVVGFIIYRIFFQFDNKEVQIYIKEEADKYGSNSSAAFAIIAEGVDDILASHNKTQQVLKSAKASNLPSEQELVNAAINQCISYGYLSRPNLS